MRVEQFGNAGAGNDNAGVAMAGREDAEAAGLKVEGGRVAAAGQRVQDDGHVEFASLQAVGRIGDHVANSKVGERALDGQSLVAVRRANRDA